MTSGGNEKQTFKVTLGYTTLSPKASKKIIEICVGTQRKYHRGWAVGFGQEEITYKLIIKASDKGQPCKRLNLVLTVSRTGRRNFSSLKSLVYVCVVSVPQVTNPVPHGQGGDPVQVLEISGL